MMKKLIYKALKFIGLILILNNGVAFAQEEGTRCLTFDQTLEITRQNSHVMKQMEYLLNEKKQENIAAKGYYLPKVGITASYMLLSDNLHLDLTPVKNAITPIYGALGNYGVFSGVPNPDPATNKVMPILPDNISTQVVRQNFTDGLAQLEAANWDETIQKKEFGTVAATFQWPLYAGGKIRAANAVTAIESKEAVEQARQKDAELISELVERYFGLCLAQQALYVRTDVLNGMQKHLDDALKMERQGLIANAEVLHARVYHAEAEREVNKAQRTLNILNDALLNSMAIDTFIEIKPVSSLFYLDSIKPVKYFIDLASKNSPLIKQVDAKKELSLQNYKVQVSEFLPTVALQGMYDIANKDLSPYMPDWTVGIGLKWNLFDGELRYKKIRAASFKAQQVDEYKAKATSDLNTIVNKLYQELEMNREQLSELEISMQFAEEYLKVREKAFYQDMSNSAEVMDARLALAKVSIERLQTMYNYDLTLARLLQYCGIPDQFNAYRTKNDVKTEEYKPIND